MKRSLAFLFTGLMLLLAACGGSSGEPSDSSDSSTTTTAKESSTTTAKTADSKAPETSDATGSTADAGDAANVAVLKIIGVSFSTGEVKVSNEGTDSYSLAGHFMCNRPSYGPVTEATIEPGETVTIDASGLNLSAENGEFALYTSEQYDSASAIVAYVQWGSADGGRSSVAVEAGLIAEGEFVDNGGEDIS